MTIAAATRSTSSGLPSELQKAQDALQLPEVQDMLKRLANHNLGICMPHMHDDRTGEFKVLPPELVQVEDGLRVNFFPAAEVEQPDRYVPVAWIWHDDGVRAATKCVQKCAKNPGSTMHTSGHHSEESKRC